MKRKLLKAAALLLALIVISAGCQEAAKKGTVSPYSLSDEQTELLNYLNLNNTSMLYTLRPPEGTLGLTATSYVLENGNWVDNGGGSISWDTSDSQELKEAVVSLVYREDRTFDISIHAQGTSSFRSNPLTYQEEWMSSSQSFLSEEREIQLDEEIPVALFVADSGSSMRSFDVDSYFFPENLQEYDVVQAVTLTFSKEV